MADETTTPEPAAVETPVVDEAVTPIEYDVVPDTRNPEANYATRSNIVYSPEQEAAPDGERYELPSVETIDTRNAEVNLASRTNIVSDGRY